MILLAAKVLYLSYTSLVIGPNMSEFNQFIKCILGFTFPPNEIENCRHFLEGKQENCPKNQVIFKCQKHPVRESYLTKSTQIWQSDKQWFTTLKVTWKQIARSRRRRRMPEPTQTSFLP
jgi:hypothetical protein